MNEVYVTYEVAKLLKEKGFPQSTSICNVVYKPNGKMSFNANSFINSHYLFKDWYIFAPTQQMAMRWLIKTHNIHIETHFLRASGDYVYDIIHSPLKLDDIHSFPIVFNTREDAVEAALKYCLTNLI